MNPLVAAKTFQTPFTRRRCSLLAAIPLALLALSAGAFAIGSSNVSLAWNPNPETNIAGYRLNYGTTAGSPTSTLDVGIASTATVGGLNQGTTYHFVVVAYNTAGQTSAPSAPVSYTVPGSPNTAPVATSFSLTVAEDGQSAATLAGTDDEGDTLDFTIVASPGKGTLTGTAPNFTYRPAANATGSDSFIYRASDGALNSAPATVTVDITPANDAPVAAARSVTTAEDTNLAIALSGTDVDGDALSYAIVTAPAKGVLIGTAPALTYQPTANATGGDSFTYRVNDGALNSATATVSITITPVNDAPVASAKSATTAEDTAISVSLSATDVEGSSLTYSIITPPGQGTVTGSPPNVTYTPRANFHGADSFAYRASDGSANSAAAWISLTVTPVNDAPVATPRSATTTRDTALPITLAGTDAEGAGLTFALLTPPAHGTLTGTPPIVTYTPNLDYTGADSFTFRVNDGVLNSASATVSLSVGTTNRPPVAGIKSVSTLKGKAVPVVLTGTDADGQALTYRVVNFPAGGTVSGTPPNVTYTPARNYTGDDKFTFLVNDGTTDSTALGWVFVKVKATNKKPVATPRAATVAWNTPATLTLAGTDPDSDPLTYAIAKRPAHGTVAVVGSGPDVIYTPAAGYKGKDTFTFTVRDGTVNSAPAAVVLTVNNPNNRAPAAQAKSLAGPAKKLLPAPLTGTDPDGDALTFRVITPPASGKLTGKGPALKYKPAATFTGRVTFTYVANDGFLDSAPATVTIDIAAPVTSARAIAAGKSKAAAVGVPGDLPRLVIAAAARPGHLRMEIIGAPGAAPVLESSPDLNAWAEDRQLYLDEAGQLTLELPILSDTHSGFYRLRVP